MKLPRSLVSCLALSLAMSSTLPALAAEAPKKLLMVTVTLGFRHSCIPLSEEIVARLAKESGKFTVDFVRQPEGMPKIPSAPRPGKAGPDSDAHKAALKKFEAEQAEFNRVWLPKVEQELKKLSPANLKNYDGVIFGSTTGDLPLPDKKGFLDWIASGKAFIGVHAASDTFHHYPAFIEMLGGEFMTHGPQVDVDCVNEDKQHAACAHLPARWALFDEIYQFKNYERSKVHGLLRLEGLKRNAEEIKNNTPTRGHFPISWNKIYGKGRVFYTALGHREDLWDPAFTDKAGRKNPSPIATQFQQHVLGGILWSVGLAKGSAELPR